MIICLENHYIRSELIDDFYDEVNIENCHIVRYTHIHCSNGKNFCIEGNYSYDLAKILKEQCNEKIFEIGVEDD